MKEKNRILIAPLDWGLGHATRCIPVIRELLRQGDEVLIATDGYCEQLLRKEFPGLQFILLRGYGVQYSSFLPMSLSMLLQLPKLIGRIATENRALKKIILDFNIDAVISDNRYGLWNKKTRTVFITHQLMIKCPRGLKFLEPLLYQVHKFFISKYDDCWIPDDDRKLAGDLSHHYPLPRNVQFIGPLSRWKEINSTAKKKYDITAIISGPEPHRTSFEKIIINQLSHAKLVSLVVLGKPGEQVKQSTGPLQIESHLESDKLLDAISSSELVICRSGYSSIMDLVSVGKNAILIPTPGQTEQIYLAEYLIQKQLFFSVAQNELSLEEAIHESKKYSVKNYNEKESGLPGVIAEWRKKITG